MTDNQLPEFHDFFRQQFKAWEETQPNQRSNYTAFAAYLSHNSFGVEIKQQYVDSWIKGKTKPGEKYAPVLAEFYGKDIYKMVDVDPSSEYMLRILTALPNMKPERQRKLAEDAQIYKVENHDEHVRRTSEKRKRRKIGKFLPTRFA